MGRTRPGRPPTPRVHGDVAGARQAVFEEVWALARRIPRGRVMTYGQIATVLGSRISPRAVGWAMHGCPEGVPWQRVVNARGGFSTDKLPDMPPGMQRALLVREGVEIADGGRVDLARYRWSPPPKDRRRRSTR